MDTLTIKIWKQKLFGRMGGPLKLKFANHFIIYQKRPFRGLLGLAGYTQSSGTGELTKPKNLLNAVEWVQMTIISILNVDQYERGSRTEGGTPFSKEVFYLISDWYDFRALRIGIIPLSELDMGSKSQKIPQNSLKIIW